MYLNWWRHTLSESTRSTKSGFFFFFKHYCTFTRELTQLEWRSPSSQQMKLCSSMWTGHLGDTVRAQKIRQEIQTRADDPRKCEFRRYPQTCFWARVRNTWGGSWSLPAPVCHISEGYSPGLQQNGSGEQRFHSDMQKPGHNPVKALWFTWMWVFNVVNSIYECKV